MENRVAGSRMLQTRPYSEIEPAERAGEERREARASAWKEDLVVQFSGIDAKEATTLNGGVAQLGEHLPCKQGVKGSIPFISTISFAMRGKT